MLISKYGSYLYTPIKCRSPQIQPTLQRQQPNFDLFSPRMHSQNCRREFNLTQNCLREVDWTSKICERRSRFSLCLVVHYITRQFFPHCSCLVSFFPLDLSSNSFFVYLYVKLTKITNCIFFTHVFNLCISILCIVPPHF